MQDTDSDDKLDNVPGTSNDKPIDRYIRKTEQKIRENEMAIEKLAREEMGVHAHLWKFLSVVKRSSILDKLIQKKQNLQ